MEISGEWEANMIYFNVKELWKEQWAGANLQTKALRYPFDKGRMGGGL